MAMGNPPADRSPPVWLFSRTCDPELLDDSVESGGGLGRRRLYCRLRPVSRRDGRSGRRSAGRTCLAVSARPAKASTETSRRAAPAAGRKLKIDVRHAIYALSGDGLDACRRCLVTTKAGPHGSAFLLPSPSAVTKRRGGVSPKHNRSFQCPLWPIPRAAAIPISYH
jgi:hypothetical protein